MIAFQGKLLKRATEICGSRDALSAYLGVSDERVKLWIDAKARLPDQVFLRVADLVLEDDIARAEQDRRRGPRVGVITHKRRTQKPFAQGNA